MQAVGGASPARQGVVDRYVPRLRRVLAPALAGLLAVGVAAAPTSSAAPGAGVQATPARVLSLTAGGGFERLEVHVAQRRAAARATTSGAGGVEGPAWTACVFGWTDRSFFSDCAAPIALQSTVAEGSASGRLRFSLRDDFWGDTAVVDLVLRDSGSTPAVTWSSTPYADELRVSGSPVASVVRTADVSGSVLLTTQRGKRKSTKRLVVAPGATMAVADAVAVTAGVSAL